VIDNFTRCMDPAVGSSNGGLVSGLKEQGADGKRTLRSGALERGDNYTVRPHLAAPDLDIPKTIYNYPCLIVHLGIGVDYEANFAKNPIGTGPFELTEYAIGERCLLTKRPNYWGGEYYLDSILYLDHGDDPNAPIQALASGEVDHVYEVDINSIDQVE